MKSPDLYGLVALALPAKWKVIGLIPDGTHAWVMALVPGRGAYKR